MTAVTEHRGSLKRLLSFQINNLMLFNLIRQKQRKREQSGSGTGRYNGKGHNVPAILGHVYTVKLMALKNNC